MKKVTADEKIKIHAFEEAVDDMINGKFILADVKISKILKTIAQSKELYNLLAECLLNFNFEREFDLSKTSGFTDTSFHIPEENYKRIAFVFCFLVEVDNRKIAFYDFINTYFRSPNSTSTTEYKAFAETMLIPFKEEILNRFDMEGVESEEKIEEQPQKNVKQIVALEEQILTSISELKMELDLTLKIKESRRIEIMQYLNALTEATKLKNMKIINALLIALDKEIVKVRPLKDAYAKFTTLIIKLY